MMRFSKFKPAVDKRILILFAALLWIGAGTMLLTLAYSWLASYAANVYLFFGIVGFILAMIIHHFGFLKVVDRNLGRLLPIQGKRCAFAFMTWKNYFLVILMISMGIALRHSPVPKTYLAALYIGIGLALILSSIRYARHVIWHGGHIK